MFNRHNYNIHGGSSKLFRSPGLLILWLALTQMAPCFALSEKKEKQIGKELHTEIMKKMPIYRDPALQDYVTRIGQKMADMSTRNKLDYTFTIIDSPDINAFALPGGYIYINRGLMTYLNSEAQLAAVLGHEVAHVAAKHAIETKRLATISKALSTILAVGTQIAVGAGGAQIGELSNVAGTAIVSGYGRDNELEADRLGAQYLYKASYNPKAMEQVIGILKENEQFSRIKAREEGKKPATYHGLFASHPRNDQRLQEVIASVGQLPESKQINNEEVFRGHMSGLEFGDTSAFGVHKGSRFYHKSMNFTLAFPYNWTMQNSTNTLVAFPSRQDVFLQLQVMGDVKGLSPEKFLRGQKKLAKMTDGQAITQNGLSGYTGVIPATEKRGSVRVAVIYHNNLAFYFTGVNRNPDTALNYDAFFMASISSFRPLVAQDYKLAAGLTINYITADKHTRYESLAQSSKIPRYAEEQLRLINAHYPNGEPEPGQWFKIVE